MVFNQYLVPILVLDGVCNWGVKFEVILLLNFHPVFMIVILCRVGKRAIGSQNRMIINIARLPTLFLPARWASGLYDLDIILRTSARLPTLPFKKTEQNEGEK